MTLGAAGGLVSMKWKALTLVIESNDERTDEREVAADFERVRLAGFHRAVEIAAGHDIATVVADPDDVVAVSADESRGTQLARQNIVAVVAENDVVEPEGGNVICQSRKRSCVGGRLSAIRRAPAVVNL